MEAGRRLPRPITDAGNLEVRGAGRRQGQRTAIAGHPVTARREARGGHLHPLERRIDVSRRAARAGLFAEHRPRLQRVPDLELDVAAPHRAVAGKAELVLRLEPLPAEREPRTPEIAEHL